METRRSFLRRAAGLPAAYAAWLQAGCGSGSRSPAAPDVLDPGRIATGPLDQAILPPKVNGAINVHPLRCLGCSATDSIIDPSLVALQLQAAYELGFDGIRITAPLSDRYSLLAAIPYVRGARALGIDALVLLSDFSGLTLARALHDDNRRRTILGLYASLFAPDPPPLAPELGGLGPGGIGRIAFQVLNEPVGFVGLPPETYVREVLTPCFAELHDIDPGIIVVAAAETGNLAGPVRVRAMLEAGVERVCDRIAYHVYNRQIIGQLPEHVRRVVWVTESGVTGTSRHLPWVREVFPEIVARLPDVTRIFYFDLFDATRDGFRVLDIREEPSGYRGVAESAVLVDYWKARVLEAAGGRALVPFATLVPEVRAYFPSEADVRALDSAPF
jgi:hypothetical protein